MLSKIKIKNFKSIQELTLDLSFAEGKAPNGYKESEIISFLEPTSKHADRVVSVMNLYGANASGKSNIAEALFYVKTILKSGLNSKYYTPNKLKDLENETLVELDFFVNGNRHKYILAYNGNGITKESLFAENKVIFSIEKNKGNFKEIETQLYKEKDMQEIFKIACLEERRGLTELGFSVQVNTFLNSVVSKLPSLNRKLSDSFDFLEKKLTISKSNRIPRNFSIDYLAKSNREEDIHESCRKISSLIKKLDIDIEKFNHKRTPVPKAELHKDIDSAYRIDVQTNSIVKDDIFTYHKNDRGELIRFKFIEESLGTQVAFGIGGVILKTLENGGVLIVDELDRSLHPIALNILIRMFKDKQYNKNNAQLISMLHTTDILEKDIYKKSEFAFVNKNLKKGSLIKRLSDFEDIRNDMNFRDRYLDGLYSGIPYVHN